MYHQVKHALTLVRDGVITIETINEAHGKCPILPKSINFNTRKQTSVAIAFNDDGWGKVSSSFTKSAMRIAQSIKQFEKIERAAKEFSKTSTQLMDSLTATDGQQDLMDDNDDRVNLEGNDSDENEDNLD